MKLETEKSSFTGDEGIEKHLVRVYLNNRYETTFSVIHDEHTGRLCIGYIPGRIEVKPIHVSTPTPKEVKSSDSSEKRIDTPNQKVKK